MAETCPRPLRVFVFEQHNLGVFAQLTQIMLVASYCIEANVRPFFIVRNENLIDARHGANWLDYFFEQRQVRIADARQVNNRLGTGQVFRISSRYDVNRLARAHPHLELQNELGGIQDAARLFHRHLRIRPPILGEVARFVRVALAGAPFVGVHYRGTDKVGEEGPPISFDTMMRLIDTHLGDRRLFVATDSREFLDFCIERLEARVHFFHKPEGLSHLAQREDNYEKGRSAIVDALILSKSQLLIKTPSLLSAWSKIFSPALPLVLVGEPFAAPWREGSLEGAGYWPESRLYERQPEVVAANGVVCFVGTGESSGQSSHP